MIASHKRNRPNFLISIFFTQINQKKENLNNKNTINKNTITTRKICLKVKNTATLDIDLVIMSIMMMVIVKTTLVNQFTACLVDDGKSVLFLTEVLDRDFCHCKYWHWFDRTFFMSFDTIDWRCLVVTTTLITAMIRFC